MTYACNWRKAMVISVCLHLFLVIGAGHLMASLPAALPIPEEVILEMDLVSNPAEPAENRATLNESSPVPDITKPAVAEMPPVLPDQTETSDREPDPVVTTSELAMTAAEMLDATPVSNQSHSSKSVHATSSPGAASVGDGSSQRGIAAPSILSKVNPVYPSAARQAGLEGTVILRIHIAANGRPGEISVARSTGHAALDEAAITAVGKWQFVPAKDRVSGRTVACTTTLPVSFRLHQ